jgi:superfamily II DNA or RNA helicase
MNKKCVLELSDEVNCRLTGLDPDTRRKLNKTVEYFVPGARYSPAFKLGRWNGKKSFCDIGGRTYINLLDKLLPVVYAAGYEIEIDDKRVECDISLPTITEDYHAQLGKTWPAGHPAAGQAIRLRDYQSQVLSGFMKNPHGIQQSPTGSGKTLITATLSAVVEPMGRSVVIVPSKDLVTQTEADYINLGLDVGVYFGDRKDTDKTHTICTWQSLEVLHKTSQLDSEVFGIEDFLSGVVAVIVDEVHRAKGQILQDLLAGPFAHIPIRWGLTGTMPKEESDYLAVLSCLGSVIDEIKSKELQDAGYLSHVNVDVIQLQDPFVAFKDYQSELTWLTTDQDRLQYISDIINAASEAGNVLLLIDRIKTGEILAEMNPDWTFVSGSTKSKDRKTEYDAMAPDTKRVTVATFGIASTGINITYVYNLAMLEAGKSFTRVIQSIGRGVRRKDGVKESVRILDICSSSKYSKRHLTERKKFYKEQEFPFNISKVEYKGRKKY